MEGHHLGHLVAGQARVQPGAHGVGIQRGAGQQLHRRGQRFTELVVGDAEHRAVGHARHGVQHAFDLHRVDVHATADHHVGLAVDDEQEAVVVEVAHVAHGFQPITLHLRARLWVADVAEVGKAGLVDVDQARRAAGQRAALFVADLELHAVEPLAGRARLAQRLLAGQQRHVAQLAGSVALVDHRAPPVDHRALHLGRARAARAGHEAHRAQVVLRPHLGRQRQHAHVHGGHQVGMRQPVLLDQLQRAFGVEARLDVQRAAFQRQAQGVAVGGAVVHRRVHQRAHAGAGFKAVGQVAHPRPSRHLRRRGRCAHDALRPPGGA